MTNCSTSRRRRIYMNPNKISNMYNFFILLNIYYGNIQTYRCRQKICVLISLRRKVLIPDTAWKDLSFVPAMILPVHFISPSSRHVLSMGTTQWSLVSQQHTFNCKNRVYTFCTGQQTWYTFGWQQSLQAAHCTVCISIHFYSNDGNMGYYTEAM